MLGNSTHYRDNRALMKQIQLSCSLRDPIVARALCWTRYSVEWTPLQNVASTAASSAALSNRHLLSLQIAFLNLCADFVHDSLVNHKWTHQIDRFGRAIIYKVFIIVCGWSSIAIWNPDCRKGTHLRRSDSSLDLLRKTSCIRHPANVNFNPTAQATTQSLVMRHHIRLQLDQSCVVLHLWVFEVTCMLRCWCSSIELVVWWRWTK